jgi:hypothetical protein
VIGNSKGFRMRRDHEAKQELGISDDRQRPEENPERPLTEQDSARQIRSVDQSSPLGRIWRRIRG